MMNNLRLFSRFSLRWGAWFWAFFSATAAACGAEGYFLLENFSGSLPVRGELRLAVDLENARVGLAAGRLTYRLRRQNDRAEMRLPPEARRLPGPGILHLWMKGDGSGNRLVLIVAHAKAAAGQEGVRYEEIQDVRLPAVALDFTDWREISCDASSLPADRYLYWAGLALEASGKKEPCLSGEVLLDDLRLFPSAGKPPSAVTAVALLGERCRSGEREIPVSVDLRNFSDKPWRGRGRFTLTDRNETLVASRDISFDLAAAEGREEKIALAAEDPTACLPPFRLTGDILVPEVPEAGCKLDTAVVCGNSYLLFESFADAEADWQARNIWGERGPAQETQSECYRFMVAPQNAALVERIAFTPEPGSAAPPGRFALRLRFQRSAAVFNFRPPAQRYLPGDAFRLGIWIKGDGSGARVFAVVHDFSDMADFWHGGWKRVCAEIPLCALDFQGWRYVEADLPGNGLGTHLPKGSTPDLDFPLELAALAVDAADPQGKRDEKGEKIFHPGVVEFGPIFVHTQQRHSEALALFAGYDRPDRCFISQANAWAVVQNGSPWQARNVEVLWAILDRQAEQVANGKAEVALKPREMATICLELSAHGQAMSAANGPLRLQISANDRQDPQASASAEIVLAKPDSAGLAFDFESEREYSGMRFAGSKAEVGARTDKERAHSGERALAMPWQKAEPHERLVSLDPALPGIPAAIRLWVHGDGSGARLALLAGDMRGVNKGAPGGQWDVFTLRAYDESQSEEIVVDWTGWRECRFRLPAIPASWQTALPVLSFVPSYPLGLHLLVRGKDAGKDAGVIHVDDIFVETHLLPDERLHLRLGSPRTNVLAPSEPLSAYLQNFDTAARTIKIAAALYDWRGNVVQNYENAVALAPGGAQNVAVFPQPPAGAYEARVTLHDGDRLCASVKADVVVADLAPLLGENWLEALREDWRLRQPLASRFDLVDEDWDWLEYFPGNFQAETARGRLARSRSRGNEPYLLLGYSAYWAAGPGYADRLNNSFQRRPRDAGHAVDIFMPPESREDWDNYVCEVMRAVGTEVAGWAFWDNPDGAGGLALRPEQCAELVAVADRWRRVYCPDKPILLNGLQRDTAVGYLERLAATACLKMIDGVHMRLDLGRLSPEDGLLMRLVEDLRDALAKSADSGDSASKAGAKKVFLSDLDWAIEKDEKGLGPFDQAAYVSRSLLLLAPYGIRPALAIANVDFEQYGLGLAYRQPLACPPLAAKTPHLFLKPAWLAAAQTVAWLRALDNIRIIQAMDLWPGRTWCLYGSDKDADALAAIVWRNDDRGFVSFASAGLEVLAAADVFGASISAENGEYAVGKIPVRFSLRPAAAPSDTALACLRVRDADAPQRWPQQPLALIPVGSQSHGYTCAQAKEHVFTGRDAAGERRRISGAIFASGGSEKFSLDAQGAKALVLRKTWFLDESGHEAEIFVNGKPTATMSCLRSDPNLASGLRESSAVITEEFLAGQARLEIETRYAKGGNACAWAVFAYDAGPMPLTAWGAVHADQNIGQPRPGRNILGAPLRIGDKSCKNGFGCFARSLLEFALNRQIRRFRCQVGVDAITEGRGSVIFEVYGDGRKLWSSGVMSGLDAPRPVDVAVEGVNRLRLVVDDAGDGNKFDAADWCEPEIEP